MLEILLLGEQRVRGAAGRTASPRTLDLLAYLVLHAGRAQARPHLAGVLWPESTEAQARTNLRRELHHLRALLGDGGPVAAEPAALTWRDAAGCRVDVHVFRVEREAALAARAAGDTAAFLRHAAAAAAEYRGPLLPGSYQDWVLEHRERLRQECADLCGLAADALRAAGDRQRAIELARTRITLDPLAETGYRDLMELQAETGDRAAAMRTYHRCASVLERELGVAPDPRTDRARDRLLGRGQPGAAPAGGGLVGREAEIALMHARWQRALAGAGGLVLVSGEPGVGKSRLSAELAAAARAGGAATAATRCFGSSERLALAPVAEWLRGRDLRASVATLEPVWQAEVERLVPSASPGPPGRVRGERAMADAWQRHRFYEGLTRAVLSAGRPTLLVLDDLQWCDQETIAWLSFLLGYARGVPLLVVATARTDELDANREVLLALRTARAAGLVTDVPLGPLDIAGTAQLASSLGGRALTEAETVLLHAATDGFPLFVIEAARSLHDTDADADAADAGGSIPVDLQAVLRRRLDQPSAAARAIAGLAAAVGRDFSLDLLSEASDLDTDALVGAVDELWRRRILRVRPRGYDFSHDLLRDAAYSTISPPRRWLLHRRLAQGLELLHSGRVDEVAAQLADQYERGGRPDRALHYFGRAAEQAAAVFANTEALRHHRRCLALVEQLPAGRDRDRHELAVRRAMAPPLNAAHGYSSIELQTTLERSATLAEQLGLPGVQLGSLIGLFAVRFVQGENALGWDIGVRALALAEAEPELAGQAHFAYAGAAMALGRLAEAAPHFALAWERAPAEPSYILGTRFEVHARGWASHVHWLLGDEERAVAVSAAAVERGRTLGHPYSLAIGLAYDAVLHQLRGDRAAMRAAAAELSEMCRRYGFAYYSEWAVILSGWEAGGERGLALIRDGIARLRAQGAWARMPYWLSLLADCLIAERRADDARGVLDAALVAAEQRDDRWWLPEVLRLRAGLETGARATDLLTRAADLARDQSSRTLAARCHADLARIGVRAPVV